MPESRKAEDGSDLDAIEDIVREGIRRGETGARRFFGLGVGSLIAILAVLAYFFWPATRIDPAVAVFLPTMTEDAVAGDNALRQWQGFDKGFDEARVAPANRHVHHFDYKPRRADQPEMVDGLIDKMQSFYANNDVRTFIITMSGAALPIKERFIEWRNTLPKRERPVLVATVASATGIVDRENGIFRHYIRSRDEAGVIATYVESHSATDVFLFYVNDSYGAKAKDVLRKRLGSKLNDPTPANAALSKKDQQDIDEQVATIIGQYSGSNAVVVIVGYGAMIRTIIETLRDTELKLGSRELRFDGTILVASTFTEEKWRPRHLNTVGLFTADKLPFDQRVLAVGPTHIVDNEEDRGVVYQFSYLTLVRALHCQDQLGIERFWQCWTSDDAPSKGVNDQDWVDVEFTADGDSRVGLRVLRNGDW